MWSGEVGASKWIKKVVGTFVSAAFFMLKYIGLRKYHLQIC
jgi:hypothetical protein